MKPKLEYKVYNKKSHTINRILTQGQCRTHSLVIVSALCKSTLSQREAQPVTRHPTGTPHIIYS